MSAVLQSWLSEIEPILHQYGLGGVFGCIFLESMGLPLPGETMLIFAGAYAGTGKLNLAAVGVTAFAAAVLGDAVGYLIGRYGGRRLVFRYGSWFGITQSRMRRVEGIIRTHGVLIVAVARFIVLLRQLNGLAAGTAGMQWSRFMLANTIGSALWVATWLTLAYQFGHNIHAFPYLLRHLNWAAAVLLLVLVAGVAIGCLMMYFGKKSGNEG